MEQIRSIVYSPNVGSNTVPHCIVHKSPGTSKVVRWREGKCSLSEKNNLQNCNAKVPIDAE